MKITRTVKLFLICAVLFVLAGTLLFVVGVQKSIVINLDGNHETFETRAWTVGGALRRAGIQLSSQDKVTPKEHHLIKSGELIVIDRARRVYILADGDVKSIVTNVKDIATIFAQANIAFNSSDKLFINGQDELLSSKLPSGTNTITIQIKRAVPITISIAGAEYRTYQTAAATVLEALWDNGIRLEAGDMLSLPADTKILPNLEVEIIKGQPITIRTQFGSIVINSTANTVGDALAQAGLSLQGLDYSIPGSDKPIPTDREIQLIRLQEEVIIEQTPLQFDTEYQPVDDLEIDTRETIEPGEYGLTSRRIRIRYQDGIEVSRIVDNEWIAKEPKSRIIGYGIKIVKKIADTPDGPIEYWRSLRMYAVSYRPKETDNTTASGLPLKKGVAAIDRRYIPFYTRMYIPGYGEAIAADVGGGVIGRMIDLGFSNEDYESWHQWVTVYFLWPPPDNIVWFIP